MSTKTVHKDNADKAQSLSPGSCDAHRPCQQQRAQDIYFLWDANW